jgi:hypothetical protein
MRLLATLFSLLFVALSNTCIAQSIQQDSYMHQQINPGLHQFKLALISTDGQQVKTTPSSDGNMVKPTWTTQNGWFTTDINVNMTRPHKLAKRSYMISKCHSDIIQPTDPTVLWPTP